MQDRFRFRVWEKDQKIMKECTQITLDKDQKGSMCDVKGKVTAHLVYQPHYILMQSTGLKDKNGKLIYEGDIIKIPDDYDTYGMFACEKREVYFNEGGFRLKPKWDKNSRGNWLEDTKDFEVIGNIYENPELLEVKE